MMIMMLMIMIHMATEQWLQTTMASNIKLAELNVADSARPT